MNAIIVVDAFWGDSGKGKVAAFLAQKHQAAYSVRAGIGTNAGHSILFADGSEIRTRQLPCGFLHPDTQPARRQRRRRRSRAVLRRTRPN